MNSEGKLLYDSARTCATVGQRAGLRIDRSLMFQSNAYSVDLVLHAGLSDWSYVYGQVIQHRDGVPVPNAAIRFEDAESCVRTDGMGQFTVGINLPDAHQTLRVETPDGPMLCEIPSLDEASEF